MDNKINMLENNDFYLISYVYNRNEGYGFGDTYKNGNEIQDIETLKEEIKQKNNFKDIVLLNIVNLSKV